jgi:hypothetical protein
MERKKGKMSAEEFKQAAAKLDGAKYILRL